MVKHIQFWMFFALPSLLLIFAFRQLMLSHNQWRNMKRIRSLVSEDMGLVFISRKKQ